jgi:hypothetical protein
MISDKTTVATFSDREKAEAVRDRLEKAGIHAETADESFYQKYWFLSKPLAGDKVYVTEAEFAKARECLQAAEPQEHLLQGEVRCPNCGSVQVDYPQFTRKFITTTMVEVFCLLHIIDKKCYCKGCQHTWPIHETLRHKTDVLGWPTKEGAVKAEKG